MGERNWRDDIDPAPYRDYAVEKFIPYPLYSLTGRDDIAIIRLNDTVELNDYIKVIPLASKDARLWGRLAKVSGWGMTHFNDSVLDPIIPSDLHVDDVMVIEPDHDWYAGSREYLYGKALVGYGNCYGDSGGPLIVTENGRSELIGVVKGAWGNCDESRLPGIYMRVATYRDWILENLSNVLTWKQWHKRIRRPLTRTLVES